ncbi:hypothetical protein VTO42DRAFT_6323 [Malbranchea cinnamomea]
MSDAAGDNGNAEKLEYRAAFHGRDQGRNRDHGNLSSTAMRNTRRLHAMTRGQEIMLPWSSAAHSSEININGEDTKIQSSIFGRISAAIRQCY